MGGVDELTARVPQSAREAAKGFWFHGNGGTLWGISVVTLLFSVCTLGIYYPWGKVKARKYLYGQTEFEGDRFAFHGNGKELLVGWLKVAAIIAVLAGVTLALKYGWDNSAAIVAGQVLAGTVGWLLAPVAIVGSQRYRLSRSSWRGIRFSFRGKFKEFFPKFAVGSLLVPVTLGIYTPYFQNAMRKYLVEHSYFGTRRFTYEGEGKDLLGRFLIALPLTVLTAGLYFYWYRAFRDRYFWNRTEFGGARFTCTVTGWDLLVLDVTNVLLVLVTLGIGLPWARVRTLRYKLGHLALVGGLDVAGILQDAQDASATGEELSDFIGDTLLDIELGL